MATRYEYYNAGDDNYDYFYQNFWGAQTFAPTTPHRITSVKLKLFRQGSPGTVTVSIRATLFGHPYGGDLCSGTIDGNALAGAPGDWREITLGAGTNVTTGAKFAIVVRITGDAGNTLGWRQDRSSPTYINGNSEVSDDSGSSWTSQATRDFMFEEWGEPPPPPPPPDPPTNVQATDGVHTDKVRITWTKSTGATGYQVYRNGVALGWLGNVATFDDTGAGAPSITPGSAIASDGVYIAHVALSLSGQSANNGATHTYKVKAKNASGESGYSGTNTGYRGVGALTYQWQRSAGDSDASYSNISGATASTYNDTGAPADGSGRYYRCVENAPGATQQISAADRGYRAGILAPTVTNGTGASNIQETTARLNGQVTANGGENPTVHIYWGETDGVTTPGNWDHDENLGVKAVGNFYKDISGLTGGKTYYYRCYATNSAGSDWADSTASFTTKPAAPTNVSATDGVHTDKVVITWTKSTGATGYQVYRDGVGLGWLGDVATYDDAGAGAPSITPGAASASDGTSIAHVALSLSGQSANNGTAHTYKVRARNATGESADSTTNAGYRGHGALTYQWQRSAGDSDASYSNIAGATTAAYNDVGAPADGSGRYYRCVENATGAAQAISSADRGYRITSPTVTTQPVSNIGNTGATGNVTITDDGGEACSKRGICWNTTGNPTTADSKSEETDSFGVGAFTRLMTGLTPGQKYYAKGYAINSAGTSYGGEVSFTTKPSAPSNLTATTISETQINLTWTKGTGAVNTVIRRKVNSAPTSVTDGVEVYNGPGTSHNDTTCSPGNHYYYRAWSYHTTSGYSDSYDTADSSTVTMPTGTTEAATLIGDVNATLNGKVTDDGGEPCLVRFQYGTTAAYGTNTAWQTGKVTDDTFSQRITGLTPLTGYHFRAQIKNSAGTANGADKTFTTITLPTSFLKRVLRDVFGGGSDISAANPLQVYDPVITSIGNLQVPATTIDLNQAADTYDLFIGTGQDVVVEKLVFRMPDVDISGGGVTSISLQTDDATAQVFISAADGVLANLTQEAQLAWTGACLIKVGTKIQLTIAGAAAGVACSCDVIAECRAVVTGGYLTS